LVQALCGGLGSTNERGRFERIRVFDKKGLDGVYHSSLRSSNQTSSPSATLSSTPETQRPPSTSPPTPHPQIPSLQVKKKIRISRAIKNQQTFTLQLDNIPLPKRRIALDALVGGPDEGVGACFACDVAAGFGDCVSMNGRRGEKEGKEEGARTE
jgi:hypothetical protein